MLKFITSILLFLILSTGYSQEKSILKTYNKKELLADYDLLVSSLKEAHTGLYWYNTVVEFDSIVNNEREKIKDGMNSYEFFKISSRIVTATKEGHCNIGSSRDIGEYFNQKALLIPFSVKMLNQKLYILNNIENNNTKGQIITKINNISIEKIINTIFSLTPNYADGNITTGKLRFSIDYSSFTYYYADFFKNKVLNNIELLDPKTNKISQIKIKSVSAREYRDISSQIKRPNFDNPIELNIIKKREIAHLSIHSFKHTYYDKEGNEKNAFNVFSSKIDSVFNVLSKCKIKKLIIDIRNNTGGTEGYEDYVFSYLTNKFYSKYKYVQTNSVTFSFLKHTQFNTVEKQKEFEKDMNNEFYLGNDGRYLRKKGFMKVEPPNKNPFIGKVFVIISGKTYSGGSEFAALLKGNTNAVFIGEETAGGFYGQTSGFRLNLTLPNTGMKVRIPLLKFVVNAESENIPFGRGIIPDYKVQSTFNEFTNGIDTELNYTLELIKNKK